MIMEQLRSGNFVKWVMVVVVVTFVGTIFFAWGMDVGGASFSKSVVAEVGDKKVQFSTFNEDLMNRYKSERQNEELSSYRMATIREELFQQIVAQVILEKEIKDLRLKASTEELIAFFRSNPPEGIAQNPYFMTDSVFDTTKYLKFLDSPEAYSIPGMAFLEEYHSRLTIPVNQLQLLVSQTAKITDLEARDKVLAAEEKADLEYLYVSASAMETAPSPEAELKAYYSAHSDSFKTPGMAELEYVSWPKVPSAADEEIVRNEIEAIRGRLDKGETFEALAAELSDDGSAKDSGDLGFFQKGMMVKPFEEAAFALKPGELSAPVRSPFGWHLIKLIERKDKENKIRARHILLKVNPSVETVDALKEAGESLSVAAKDTGAYAAALRKQGLTPTLTGVFEKGSPVPGFETESRFVSGLASFAHNPEKTADVFENDAAVYVFRAVRRCDEGTAPFAFVADRIRRTLDQNKRLELARVRAESAYGKVANSGLTLKAVSEADTVVKYALHEGATRELFLPLLGASSKAVYRAFALSENGVTPATEASNGYAVVRLLKKHPLPPEMELEPKIQAQRRTMLDQLRYTTYAAWFEKKKSGLKIVNNIDLLYNQ